jgi:hypothetical protein
VGCYGWTGALLGDSVDAAVPVRDRQRARVIGTAGFTDPALAPLDRGAQALTTAVVRAPVRHGAPMERSEARRLAEAVRAEL